MNNKYIVLPVVMIMLAFCASAQRPTLNSISSEIETLNDTTVARNNIIISYRGLSYFLGEKIAKLLIRWRRPFLVQKLCGFKYGRWQAGKIIRLILMFFF